MELLWLPLYLGGLVLPGIMASRGTWYRGAYGAVALGSVLAAFFVASPWPRGSTPEADMVAQFMNRWRGECGLFFVAVAFGAILGAMLYRPATRPGSSAPSRSSDPTV